MHLLDNYIFDSQFSFLNEDEKLKRSYHNSVLAVADNVNIGPLTAFFRKETWDTEKFKRNTGRLLWLENKVASNILYHKIIEECRRFECCYVRLNKEHSFCEFARQAGLITLSTKVSQHLILKHNHFSFDTSMNCNEYNGEVSGGSSILEQVLELSKNSFNYNRFKSDVRFSNSQVQEIYSNWIINEIRSGNSKLYFITENSAIASFLLYCENISPLKEYKTGFVSLVASSPTYKEKRYASTLLNFILNKAKEQKTDHVIANTECKNTGAINFFKRNNFKETAFLNEYHIWN